MCQRLSGTCAIANPCCDNNRKKGGPVGSGDRFLVHTGTVHGGFAVLLRTSCYECVIMILYCINMLDMKYACCRVDMCCVGCG